MNITLIGGTGFIGSYLVKRLLADNHQLTLLTRSQREPTTNIRYIEGNLNNVEQIDYAALFENCDVLFYCAGIDERETPIGDPYQFFYKANVTDCVALLEKAKSFGVKKALVTGSVFTYIDREYPESKLSEKHTYIRSRKAQIEASIALANEDFQVNIIEIPFVFGKTKIGQSLWKGLVNYIRVSTPLFFPEGGANVISATSLADAMTGAMNYLDSSGPQVVGDENMQWPDIAGAISQRVNDQPKHIQLVGSPLFNDLTKTGAYIQDIFNMKSGLDHHHIGDLLTHEAFIETDDIKAKLHYSGGDIEQAFNDTIECCPETPLVSGLQKSVNWLAKSSQQIHKTFSKK